MTEEQWLACDEALALFDFLPDRVSIRKMRLLACACARRLWPALAKEARLSLEVAERYADGLASRQELRDARGPNYSGVRADNCASLAAYPSQGLRRQVRGVLVQAVSSASADEDGWVRRTIPAIEAAEKAAQVALVRDIFGNPFRPVAVDPAWLKWERGATPKLAEGCYEQRCLPAGTLDIARLSVLADALQDAGCDDADILTHLRSPGPHVRGCWALDLVLGRQ
jgi:hypothetical protein